MSKKPFEHLPDGHPLKDKEVVVLSNEETVLSLIGNLRNEMQHFEAAVANIDLDLQLDCVGEALAYSGQITWNLQQVRLKVLQKKADEAND